MGKIKILSKELINIIAAGEVVERPASVVKELLENAIDANSTFIRVNIKNYGQDLIEVIDNGSGMDKEDALTAFEQHATSKISSQKDLENIMSLGFRGEALASISSVSERTEIETKANNGEPTIVEMVSGIKNKKKSSRVDRGTKISVYNLFKNVPARKKFLKTPNTEFRNIVNTFIDIALINIDSHFELYHNEKLIYRLTKANSIQDRIFEIWGKAIAVSFMEEKTTENSLCKIQLVLEKPENAKKNTNFQYIYVNDRRVDGKVIQSATKEAYQGFIHKDLKPSYIILIHMNPAQVDVNVHPRKLEVRFLDPQSIFRAVYSSIKKVLENSTRESIQKTIEEVRKNIEDETSAPSKKNQFINDLGSFKKRNDYLTPSNNYKTHVPEFSKVQDAISFSKELSIGSINLNHKSDQEEVNSNKLTQIFNTYIAYEFGDEIIFIDQHAAAEKINFEKLLYEVGGTKTKPLLVPTILDLKNHEKEIILESKENLEEIGIIIEDFGGNTIQVLEIPEALNNIDFHSYLDEIINNKEDFSWIRAEYSDIRLSNEIYNLLALTACHGSIRAGQKLSEYEMLNIVNDLKKLKQPNNCPHGRPTSWKLKKQEIEKNFKRII